MSASRRVAAAVAALMPLVLSLTPTGSAAAAERPGGRSPVDPTTITPPLNPSFTWTCQRVGDKTLCEGERHDAWDALNTGIPCGGGFIYSTGTDERTLRRWGDAEGRALHTQGHARIRETLSLSPDMSGRTASAIGQFNDRYRYPVPGDIDSRVQTISGIDVRVTVRGSGVVMKDVGVKSFDIDDNLLFAHGQHDILDGFDEAFAKVCAALLA